MDRRTTGIIATIAAIVLCGLPGLISLCLGALFAWISVVPNADIDVFGRNEPRTAMTTGLVILCLGAIFILIPFLIGFLTLRNRPAQPIVTVPPPDEPIPPPS